MAETSFHLEIITPEHAFFIGTAQSLVIPTPGGQLGVLRGHVPMVTTLDIGTMRICVDHIWKTAFISEGFADINTDEVFVFAQAAEWPEEIDMHRAEEAQERAQERLRRQLSQREYAWSTTALARARVRIRVGANRSFEE